MRVLQYIWKNAGLKICNSKMAAFLLLMLVAGRTFVNPLRQFSAEVDYPVSWCVFPFVLCSFTYLILFWFGVIYANSDVPFMQHVNMYHTIRMGRRRWVLGQIGGIFFRSFVLVITAAVSTILPLLPEVEWSNEWGKLLRTAASTNGLARYQSSVVLYYDIFSEFTPLELMAAVLLIGTLTAALIGMLMFFFSLYCNKIFAAAGGLALAIGLFPVLNLHPLLRHKLAWFVPTVWAEVARIATPDHGYYWLPPLWYMISFLVLGIGILAALILHKVRGIEFQWENEDM